MNKIIKIKGFSIVEFMVASMLIISVVGSTGLAITTSQRIQSKQYYNGLYSKIATTIFQGVRLNDCNPTGVGVVDATVASNCKASIALPELKNNNANEYLWLKIPSTDFEGYEYSISSTNKIKVKYYTQYLDVNSNSSNSCSTGNVTQPNLIKRILIISSSNMAGEKVFIDYQAIDVSHTSYDPYTHGSLLFTRSNRTPKYIEITGSPVTKVRHYFGKSDCIWFPFLENNTPYTYIVDGAPQQSKSTNPVNSSGDVNQPTTVAL